MAREWMKVPTPLGSRSAFSPSPLLLEAVLFCVFLPLCSHQHPPQTRLLLTRVLLSRFGCGETPRGCAWAHVCASRDEWQEVEWRSLGVCRGRWLEPEPFLPVRTR